MIGFWIVVGCAVLCWLLITLGVHDASPAAPFRAVADWFRQRRRIRLAAKLKESWLACWPEVRDPATRERIATMRKDVKRHDWSYPPATVKDYTGRLHELEEDGFNPRSEPYTSMRAVFDALDRDGHLIAACADASEHEVPPYESFAIVPWWLEGSVFHKPRVSPTLVMNGFIQSSQEDHARRVGRVQRFMSSHTGQFAAWTGTVNDAACVDLEQPGLGKALVAQAPTHAASWAQMLGRLDRKKAPWYRRAWLAVVHYRARARNAIASRRTSLNAYGFRVGEGPLRMTGIEGEWFVTAVHGNEIQLERPNVLVRVWRWHTRRAFVREFATYPRSGDDRVDALAYGMAWHRHVERRRWYHWFTKGARK